jgi:hypothetical protein
MIKLNRVLQVLSDPALCAGDWVEVKSRDEILASLDKDGNLDGMPFMPEMLKYCGRRFRVYKRAHKTCDFSTAMEARRVPSAVHLEGLRCSGEAHGGCQAQCLLFWKEAWLKPAEDPTASRSARVRAGGRTDVRTSPDSDRCTERQLYAAAREATDPETVYACQATRIPRFTTPLAASEVDQYVEAVSSRNVRLREVLPPLVFRLYERLVWSKLGSTGIPQRVYDLFQKLRGGVPYPNRPGLIPTGQKTPKGEPLNLQAGEFVRVKGFKEILSTLNGEARNRGLLFSQEMVPYCGQVARVQSRVSRIIDEKTGKMLHFGNDCLILENVVCRGRYNAGLSFCPRSNYPYWREIWLERVTMTEVPAELIASTPCSASAG